MYFLLFIHKVNILKHELASKQSLATVNVTKLSLVHSRYKILSSEGQKAHLEDTNAKYRARQLKIKAIHNTQCDILDVQCNIVPFRLDGHCQSQITTIYIELKQKEFFCLSFLAFNTMFHRCLTFGFECGNVASPEQKPKNRLSDRSCFSENDSKLCTKKKIPFFFF